MAEQVAIYRVEHKDTLRGPYNGGHDCSYKLMYAHGGDTHPSWQNDRIPVYAEYAAGFDSLDKLLSWFAGFMDVMVECGYHIRVFYVDPESVLHGESGRQVAFSRF